MEGKVTFTMSNPPQERLSLSQQALTELDSLLEQAVAVMATKQMPTAKLHGDWQVTETVYSVVDRDAFLAWRKHALAWLGNYLGEDSAAYWEFFEDCRFPNYLEACKGQRLLQQLKAAA